MGAGHSNFKSPNIPHYTPHRHAKKVARIRHNFGSDIKNNKITQQEKYQKYLWLPIRNRENSKLQRRATILLTIPLDLFSVEEVFGLRNRTSPAVPRDFVCFCVASGSLRPARALFYGGLVNVVFPAPPIFAFQSCLKKQYLGKWPQFTDAATFSIPFEGSTVSRPRR